MDLSLVICFFSLALMLIFAIKTFNFDQPTEEHFLSHKDISFVNLALSLTATETSTITFVGITSLGFYGQNSFLLLYFGVALARLSLSHYILSDIYNNYNTLFDYLRSNNNLTVQSIHSCINILIKIIIVGAKLYAGSLLFSNLLNYPLLYSIAGIVFLTSLYSLFGNLKTIAITDSLQCLFMFLPLLFLLNELGAFSLEEVNKTYSVLSHAKRLHLFESSFINNIAIILGGFFYGSFLFFDQDSIQRIKAAKNIKEAKISIYLSIAISSLLAFFFLSLGQFVWAQEPLRAQLQNAHSDYLFTQIVNLKSTHILKGLMLAGVLASTMSTLDSAISSIGLNFYNDIKQKKLQNKFLTSFIILVLISLFSYICSYYDGIVYFVLNAGSYFAAGFLTLITFRLLSHKSKIYNYKLDVVLVSHTICLLSVIVYSDFYHQKWYSNYVSSYFTTLLFVYLYLRIRIKWLAD